MMVDLDHNDQMQCLAMMNLMISSSGTCSDANNMDRFLEEVDHHAIMQDDMPSTHGSGHKASGHHVNGIKPRVENNFAKCCKVKRAKNLQKTVSVVSVMFLDIRNPQAKNGCSSESATLTEQN